MLVKDKRYIQNESNFLVDLINRQLVANFGKTQQQAEELVIKTKVYESLIENPIGLHDSAHKWALAVLTKAGDLEALEKYAD